MNTHAFKLGALALAMLASLPALAGSIDINFDNVASGSLADSAVPSGIHFYQAVYINDVDNDGIEIPNTEKWQIDVDGTAINPVLATNPMLNGYGPAPSGTNALNAMDQAVLMHFDTAKNLRSFSATLDNSSFGFLGTSWLYFLGSGKQILGQVAFNESVPGAVVSYNDALNGVQDVLFSSNAFYDNIHVNEVPLPPSLPLLASGLAIMGFVARKKKNNA